MTCSVKHTRTVGAILIAACWMSPGCTTSQTAQINDRALDFDKHVIITGCETQPTILTGFFSGGPVSDMVTVHVGKGNERHVQHYRSDGKNWSLASQSRLRPETALVDVINIGGEDRFLAFARGELYLHDAPKNSNQKLIQLTNDYAISIDERIPHVDITRDLNQDGLDDIVLPDFDGFWIALQRADGSFTQASRFGPAEPLMGHTHIESKRLYKEMAFSEQTIPWYLSRLHSLDFNLDGHHDLVFWNEDHFEVYLQNRSGSFDTNATIAACDVPMDAGGEYAHMFQSKDQSDLSLLLGTRPARSKTVLHSMRDLNNDGITDLVTQTTRTRSVLKQRSQLALHYGAATPDGISFRPQPSHTIGPIGATALGYQRHELRDLDGDGRVEIIHARVDTGFTKMIRAMAGNSIAMDLSFFKPNEKEYPDRPNVVRKIRPGIRLWDKRGPFFPTVLGGDIDGDGLEDLIIGNGWTRIEVFLGIDGPQLFSSVPHRIDVALTANEKNARLVDLNQDGRQDILIDYANSSTPHRFAMLVAR